MNQYRVSLWIEDERGVPDFDAQFQIVNVKPTSSDLAIAAFFLAGRHWAHWVKIQVLNGNQWIVLSEASNVTMYGSSEIWFNSSSVK